MARDPRGTNAERGYGSAHRALRQWWRPQVEAGRVRCARCGELIAPGDKWHLDHDDVDRTKYLGPSHERCNVEASNQPKGDPAPQPVTRW